jgi:hypothetical protein
MLALDNAMWFMHWYINYKKIGKESKAKENLHIAKKFLNIASSNPEILQLLQDKTLDFIKTSLYNIKGLYGLKGADEQVKSAMDNFERTLLRKKELELPDIEIIHHIPIVKLTSSFKGIGKFRTFLIYPLIIDIETLQIDYKHSNKTTNYRLFNDIICKGDDTFCFGKPCGHLQKPISG